MSNSDRKMQTRIDKATNEHRANLVLHLQSEWRERSRIRNKLKAERRARRNKS